MNIEEMQKEENFEHEVLDRLKCLDPTDFDYNAVDGSYVDAVLKARDILLTAYDKEKEKNKNIDEFCRKELAFERRLKRENREPDEFNQGRFYVSENIRKIIKEE